MLGQLDGDLRCLEGELPGGDHDHGLGSNNYLIVCVLLPLPTYLDNILGRVYLLQQRHGVGASLTGTVLK